MSSTNNLFFEYFSAYGVHIALCTILSAVTAYRREISCNRSYHKDNDDDDDDDGNDDVVDADDCGDCGNREEECSDDNPSSNNSNYRTKEHDCTTIDTLADNDNGNDKIGMTIFNGDERKELMTEQLLDEAGMYCSGKPIMNFAELLRLGLEYYDYIADKNKDEKDDSSTCNNLTTENLPHRVGNYASFPQPIMATIALFVLWKKTAKKRSMQLLSSPSPLTSSSLSSCFRDYTNLGCDPFMKDIPPDVHVQIASFLHPRDVVTLSCVSKAYHAMTEDPNNSTSVAIWKTLWHRDYAWIVYQWTIGKQALLRSNCTQRSYSKDFYFLFGQCYLNYVLAGHNTFSNCLVGIHSNIYDITSFLFSHPGSPDTLMVYSGRDATNFFNDMGHSVGARKLAMSMCVVVDRSAQNDNNDCGLFPTTHTVVVGEDNDDKNEVDEHRLPPRLIEGEDNLLVVRSRTIPRTSNTSHSNAVNNRGGGGTLDRMRTCFMTEREQVRVRVMRKYINDPTILGHEVNPYFDPFTRQWRIWYTDTDLQTIYLPA